MRISYFFAQSLDRMISQMLNEEMQDQALMRTIGPMLLGCAALNAHGDFRDAPSDNMI